MKLPRSNTRIQRLSWVGLFISIALGSLAFAGAYEHAIWWDFDNVWSAAFDSYSPDYWFHKMGIASEYLIVASIVGLVCGDLLVLAARRTSSWVRQGH
ncbi:hypothetical protein ABLT15_28050 [Paraburkholderia tropica]|uniref:hypothetical protein n=1 Tax=Paraburkholderia tropica TaxID=92647 RepID=UPI0032B43BD6